MASKDKSMGDYLLLERTSKELATHEKNLRDIGKRIAKNKLRLDLKEGLIENLDIVAGHMRNARRELDRAKKRLKMI